MEYGVNNAPLMPNSRFRYILLVLVLTLTACANPFAPQDNGPETLRLTGFLEASTTDVAPEIGGRLVEICAEEGDEVEAGQILVRLDDSLLQLQLDLDDADIVAAEAKLASLHAAVRSVDVTHADAQVSAAKTTLATAESALADAILLRDNPQALDVQIAQAYAALTEAQAHARAARHLAEAEDINVQMWEAITRDLWAGVDVQLPGGGSVHVDAPRDKIDYANRQWNLAGQTAWAAWQDAYTAEAAIKQARATIADLNRTKANPQTAKSQVIAATNARDEAEAAVEQARAALAAVRAGPTAAQIAATESAVSQARSARDAAATQLEQTRLLAPADGLISARYRSPGEVIGPHQPVLTIQETDHLQLTIYVPASHLGAFQAGDSLALEVDSAPGRQFSAIVMTIADEPEFTLQQAQNVAERAGRVYAVNLHLAESDPLLRPGLPAHIPLTIDR